MAQVVLRVLILVFLIKLNPLFGQSANEKFHQTELKISRNSEITIRDFAIWYIDFSRVKNTVVFENKIISVGHNGGFACLNLEDFIIDEEFEQLLNTDFFTNVSVVSDTLFSEKHNKIYFFNNGKWEPYTNPLPINYFSILLEDNEYIFYSTYQGEFGSILWIYNKDTRLTRCLFMADIRSVVNTDNGYLVNAYLYNFITKTSSFYIHDVKKLPITNPELRFLETRYDTNENFVSARNISELPNGTLSAYKTYHKDSIILASFKNEENIYHIMNSAEPWMYNPSIDHRLIGTMKNNSLIITDSLKFGVKPSRIRSFGNINVISEPFYGEGFTIIIDENIYNIRYQNIHPSYDGMRLNPYHLQTENTWKISEHLRYTFNWNLDENLPKPGQAEREISYKYGNHVLSGNYGNEMDGIYIDNINIGFVDRWNFIESIFEYESRLFVFFGNLGNTNFKYGLIEITDIEKFKSYQKKQ